MIFLITTACQTQIQDTEDKSKFNLSSYSDLHFFIQCMDLLKKDSRYFEIAPGLIVVYFQNNISPLDYKRFLNNSNLTVIKEIPPYFQNVLIEVPKGAEFYWKCKLENTTDIVKGVYFETLSATSGDKK